MNRREFLRGLAISPLLAAFPLLFQEDGDSDAYDTVGEMLEMTAKDLYWPDGRLVIAGELEINKTYSLDLNQDDKIVIDAHL